MAVSGPLTDASFAAAGSCLCGGVQYMSSSLPTGVTHCHCLTCRKLSGSSFLPFADFPATSITFRSAKTLKSNQHSDIAIRTHCSECGSPITMQYFCQPEIIGIAVGTIDEESMGDKVGVLNGRKRVYTKEGKKARWWKIPNDSMENFDTFSPSFQELLNNWKEN